ncbi:ATP-binding cassette domain-containing protein [Pseudoclostridium thermosuccinogenes]|jgi:NitT/TauT family transport system ATP-binding protein|uniref:ATP-binding cassette domain-containing protein n=1 Tax=Clostridium thermosuccinogenes TaxID=84032 RepID=UPI002FDAC143
MDIVVSEITKRFGSNLVLDRFSATFPKSELTFLMGPSGCGKTTLLNILMGFISPDEGTISGVPELKSAVFQEDRLCESFNAVSNVRLACDRKVDKNTIISHLERIGLKGSLSKPVSELSGGMKRRVAIVRAMLAESDILFLDEPFKGLDDETKKTTIQYVKDNMGKRTVIMVTHDMDEVKALGGRLITMSGKPASL